MLSDSVSLLIHHVKRQSTISKEEKSRIKRLLRQTLPDLFRQPRMPLSDDEDDEAVVKKEKDESMTSTKTAATPTRESRDAVSDVGNICKQDVEMDVSGSGESHTLFFADKYWYVFLRLYQVLCSRLHMLRERSQTLAQEEDAQSTQRNESTAVALRLRQPVNLAPHQYYNHTLEMVRSLLDGNLESVAFEDQLRDLLGIHVYYAFTLDKVVQMAVRQLQYLVMEELSVKMTPLLVGVGRDEAPVVSGVVSKTRIDGESSRHSRTRIASACTSARVAGLTLSCWIRLGKAAMAL